MTGIKSGKTLLLKRPGEKPERVTLDQELKSGGAGTIYSITGDSNRVIKIYHEKTLVDEGVAYQEKVESMLENVPSVPDLQTASGSIVQLAWPVATAYKLKGEFVGFAMPIIDMERTAEMEYVLSPRQALQYGLRYDLGVGVSLAYNLASVVSSLHARGHAIVDLKPINLKYYKNELNVAILDCDGFYIRIPGKQSDAPQVTLEYLAPEFQHDAQVAIPEHQDRFALAIIIFKLFNFDIHPYAGVPKNGANVPSEQAEKIKEGLYPYGVVPNKKVSPVPASVHEAFPAELRGLFDRAFGGIPALRPRADEWIAALRKFAEKSKGLLVYCSSQHLHFKDMPCATCLREEIIAVASGQQPQHKSAAASAHPSQSGAKSHAVAPHVHSSASQPPKSQSPKPQSAKPQPVVPQTPPQQSATQQSSSQSTTSNFNYWSAVVVIWFIASVIAGFYIGAKFWETSGGIAVLLYLFSGKSLGSGGARLGGALIGGLVGSGFIFFVIWLFSYFSDAKPVNVQAGNKQIETPALVKSQSAVLDELRAALSSNDLDAANGKFPLVVAEFSANSNVTNEFYGKLLTTTLNLARQDMMQNKMADANAVLLVANDDLLNPQVVSAHTSSSSKPAETQLSSLLADFYWTQKNYPQAIIEAKKATSANLFTVDQETKAAINEAHFVLANALLMTQNSMEAASEYERLQLDELPASNRLFESILALVANTQSNNSSDPGVESKKILAAYSTDEIEATLQQIREMVSGNAQAEDVARVADRLLKTSLTGDSSSEQAPFSFGNLFKSNKPIEASVQVSNPKVWFGAQVAPLSITSGVDSDAESAKGVSFTVVPPTSPAGKAGIMAGDVLLEINGHKVVDAESGRRLIDGLHVGQDVPLLVQHAGNKKLLLLKIKEQSHYDGR